MAQGRRPFDHNAPPLGRLSVDIPALDDGVVTGIDNLLIAKIARLAGAPKVRGAGVDLFRKLGDPVRMGETLYRIYADFPAELEFARQAAVQASAYAIGPSAPAAFSLNER